MENSYLEEKYGSTKYKKRLCDMICDYDDMLTLLEELIDYISDDDARRICINLDIPVSR